MFSILYERNNSEKRGGGGHTPRMSIGTWALGNLVAMVREFYKNDNFSSIARRNFSNIQEQNSVGMGLSVSSWWSLHSEATSHSAQDLELRPFKTQSVQELKPQDAIQRLKFVNQQTAIESWKPIDFFLWGFLKSKVNVSKPNSPRNGSNHRAYLLSHQ